MLWLLIVASLISTTMAISCDEARQKCAFRTGCGNALQGYILECSAILHEKPLEQCPEECQNALIALTSTDEGKQFMTCECSDTFCNETKERMEVCRPHVMKAAKSDAVVSCDAAQWICAADPTCQKALEYYHQYCKYMFSGKRCSYRCKNSISILRKQEKAAKLISCVCSGREEYDCVGIRANMDKLCFNRITSKPHTTDSGNDVDSEVKTSPSPRATHDVDNEQNTTMDDGSRTTDGATSACLTVSIWVRMVIALYVLTRVTTIAINVQIAS